MTAPAAAATEDPPARSLDAVLAEPGFRVWQDGWRRRIAASWRLAPDEDGTVDVVAPSGRWSSC